jgi:hypothetical protein
VPQKQHYYEPDAIDCNSMVTALAHDHGVTAVVTTDYARDQVVVIAKCYKRGGGPDEPVICQALVKAPLKPVRSLYVLQYSSLLDCWHQLDRGVLAVAQTPLERQWNGRPKVPARTRE